MVESQKPIVWFEEVTRNDVPTVGGKGANLGEMTRAGIPVPPGFIVTASAYFDFLKQAKLMDKIRALLKPLDSNDSKQLQNIAAQVKQLISNAQMPAALAVQIKESYKKLGEGLVAVRSSATAEDLPEASFAGQQRTFLNIKGGDDVVKAVQECWASLFEPRAIFYRVEQKFDHFKVGIAVPVQKMVQSEASGVMFTLEPVSSDRTKIIIEAVFGLGEAIVGGEVTPDLYVIEKDGMKISSKKIGAQDWKLVRNTGTKSKEPNIQVPLPPAKQTEQKISDDEIIQIACLGKRLEDHYKFPQDIEWAKEDGNLYIVQTRPVTTIKSGENAQVSPEIQAPVLLTGASASPGMATGPVKIVSDPSEIDKVKAGDVLVAEMTTPDFVPAMKRAVAIVTDRGGRTSHAAIVSRELGIPCVVGCGQATTTLTDSTIITVDGSRGKVYKGMVKADRSAEEANLKKEQIKTKTRVYVNIAQPELAAKIASRNVDGIGLLRAEFIIGQIGEHPAAMLKNGRGKEFTRKLAEGITIFAKAFNPRPVVYRTTDFKTNEYRELKGGADFEPAEENPMIGWRGASRYVSDVEVFKLEIDAIKQVRQTYKNLAVMIPFVRTVKELARTKEIMEAEGLIRGKDQFKLWMMVEVPSNIILMEKFLALGIDGISIGSNDLTQLTLGVDRDSEKLRETFDERDDAVMASLERAIKVSKSMGVTSSICGQAPSVYPELTEKLVGWGITSVSISPDMIGTTREIIAKAEKRSGTGS